MRAALVRSSRLASPLRRARLPWSNETFSLSSDVFADGGAIPSRFTCDGEDLSPPLDLVDRAGRGRRLRPGRARPGCRRLRPLGADRYPRTTSPALPEGQGDSVGIPGQNDFGRVGWGGPCPPSGQHRYEFRIYALSAPLDLDGAPTADEVDRALATNVMAEGTSDRGLRPQPLSLRRRGRRDRPGSRVAATGAARRLRARLPPVGVDRCRPMPSPPRRRRPARWPGWRRFRPAPARPR